MLAFCAQNPRFPPQVPSPAPQETEVVAQPVISALGIEMREKEKAKVILNCAVGLRPA